MSPPCSPLTTWNLSFRLFVVFLAPPLLLKVITHSDNNTHLHLPLNTHQTDDRGKIFVIFCSKQNYIDIHTSAISTQDIGNNTTVGLAHINDR